MKEKTLISVVTPIYNGAQFILDAYGCLCRQTYTHWEWVVVDDGSTDDTRTMIRQLGESDRRIRYTLQPNSGSAKLPRDRAVFQGRGELVLPLDIDDKISDEYLQQMLERMEATNADIVYPRMVFVDMATGEITLTLPVAGFDTDSVYEGRQLVRETLPEWQIGCNGGLYRRQVWVNMSWLQEHDPIWVYSDEVDERRYLLKAKRVAFAQAQYTYQNHEASITQVTSARQFQVLKTNAQLLELMEEEFGADSEEYRRARKKAIQGWRNRAVTYLRNYKQAARSGWLIEQGLAEAYGQLNASRGYQPMMVLLAIRHAPMWIAEKLMQRCCPNTYQWRIAHKRAEKLIGEQVAANYQQGTALANFEPCAVSIFCANVPAGGLVDRLRGAISVYAACQKTGRTFRLHFTHPFPLTDYLQPNKYDWRISKDKVTFAPEQTQIIIIDTQTGNAKEREWQQQQLELQLKAHTNLQLHFYTNALCCYDLDFKSLFNELFRPSERLQKRLDQLKQLTGPDYLAVSTRFLHLLGDFNEEVETEELYLSDKNRLLQACLEQLDRLYRKYGKRIVVCSDSTTFLEHAQKADYVCTIPGTVSHIGNDSLRSYAYYEKTFLDFFVIGNAQKVVLLKSPQMHNSGFPYAAARMGGKPYEVVEFEP